MITVGPVGRLGRWTATHFRAVAAAWVVIAVAAGVFAPRVEHALSGAGWEATGSQSLAARQLLPCPQGEQAAPPQSTSLSSTPRRPSQQE